MNRDSARGRTHRSIGLFDHLPLLAPIDHDRLTTIRDEVTRGSLPLLATLRDVYLPLLPPPEDPLYRFAVQDLIFTDMKRRWAAREPVFLESYLTTFPELGGRDSLAAPLIYEELRIRHRAGDRVELSAYRQRFPRQFADVDQLAEGRLSRAVEQKATGARSFGTSDTEVRRPTGDVYRIEASIGSGSGGEVFHGIAADGTAVALKLVRLDRRLTARELRALEVMSTLRHPSLIEVLASWEADEQLVIVMELADGSLQSRRRQCLAEGKCGIPAEELTRIMLDLATALDYLHAQGRLHRDVKPDNVLLVGGRAKLGDFGMARLYHRDQLEIVATLGGTPVYMAPEVWGNRVGPRSDQYSLGATYVEMRQNRPPFLGRNAIELHRAHTTLEPDLQSLPPAERVVLAKCLAKNPADRFETCVEFSRALQQAVTGS